MIDCVKASTFPTKGIPSLAICKAAAVGTTFIRSRANKGTPNSASMRRIL